MNATDAYSALYTRAASDSAGATLRALIGTNGLFTRQELGTLSGRVLPYLVWSEDGVAGASEGMRSINAAWWAYIARTGNPRTLHQIADALDRLYGSTAALAVPGGRLGVTFRGRPFVDDTLGLQGMEVRIGYRKLG